MENINNDIYIKGSIDPIPIKGAEIVINQMKNSTCKINKQGNKGTGFLCKLNYKMNYMPFLVTNYHVLNNEDLEYNKEIIISFNDIKEAKIIKIESNRIIYTNEILDVSLIEIKENLDGIDLNNCLELDDIINTDDEYLNDIYEKKSIYLLHYPKGENVVVSYGLLSKIKEKKIYHLCNTENGSSGGPILSLNSYKVIVIHR